jgi:hypothetical protein
MSRDYRWTDTRIVLKMIYSRVNQKNIKALSWIIITFVRFWIGEKDHTLEGGGGDL